VKPSSARVQQRLEAVGLRPINNVVDATNYVMMALGHPLHAYDYREIHGGKIIVRAGGEKEKFRSLDGIDRAVTTDTCVIADAERPIGLGGIIGGENSEISNSTSDVFLESAWFNPSAIRRTARRLGIKTDASYRFERGVDPNDSIESLLEAARLIVEEAGGTLEGSIDVVAASANPRTLSLRDSKLSEASGGIVSPAYALELFRRLGMKGERGVDGTIVTIPTYRGDLHEEMDLVEEVLRFFGFNNIPPSLPRLTTGDVRHEPLADAEEAMRDSLVRFGLTEVITYSFVHPERDAVFSSEQPVALANALTENLSVMRTTLFSGLLETVAHNRSYGTRDGAIFEVGRSYHAATDRVTERRTAAFVLFGNRPSGWGEPKRNYDYFDALGVVESAAAELRVAVRVEAAERPGFKRGQTAVIRAGEREVAVIGVVDPAAASRFEIKGDVIAGQLDLEALLASRHEWKMAPVSRYPGVPMVIGMFHKRSLSYQTIVDTIRGLQIPHLHEVGLWDRFTPQDSSEGEVKTALGLWYQADDRSLTQEEVAELNRSLTTRVSELLPVRIITT
jgi:phenylalanyl-tRNA synthetase beta chain